MKKHFYGHLVKIDQLVIELEKMDLSQKEKIHLLSLADSSIHHVVIDIVLEQLSEDDKKIFLGHLVINDHNKIWQHLHEKIEKAEEKIIKSAESLIEELYQDIQQAKKT